MENIIAIRNIDIVRANQAFADLMFKTERQLNINSLSNPEKYRGMTPLSLEKTALEEIKKSCEGTPFSPENVILVSGQRFPDIIADKYFGVEVKSTTKNHWTSTGSSIIESTRDEFVDNIYMLFGKLGGMPPEFKCRPYGDVLYDIAVTHSPRYLIDMELDKDSTIFAKMGTTYDEFRTSQNSIEQVRKYYGDKARKNNKKEMPWWLSSYDTDRINSFNIRMWSALELEEKDFLRSMSMILFPETLSPVRTKDKYSNLSLWLCSFSQVVCPNIRDEFSAGGKLHYINGVRLEKPIPQVFGVIVKYSQSIKSMLENPTRELLDLIGEYNSDLLSTRDLYGNWLDMCQKIADLYLGGLPLRKWIEEQVKFRI